MRAPPSDEPRCYFALLDSEWRFRYLDPDFRASLGEVSLLSVLQKHACTIETEMPGVKGARKKLE